MKLKLIYLLLIVVCLSSCSNNRSQFKCYSAEAQERTILTEENLPKLENLKLEKIDIPSGDIFSSAFVFYDTVLVVINDKTPDPYIVRFFDMNSKKIIAEYFKKGSGPNELITPDGMQMKNNLLITDITQKSISIINVDSVIIKTTEYQPTTHKIITDLLTEYVPKNSQSIIAPNYYFFNEIENKSEPEFLEYDINTGLELTKYEKSRDYFCANVSFRSVYYNDHSNQYIVCWDKYPLINIYDNNLNLQKQIMGPEPIDLELELRDGGEVLEISNSNTYYFSNGCQTENYLLLLNSRQHKITNEEMDCEEGYSKQEFWLFDNDMNLVRRFIPKNTNSVEGVYYLSYDEKNQNIYAVAIDPEEGEMVLFKFNAED